MRFPVTQPGAHTVGTLVGQPPPAGARPPIRVVHARNPSCVPRMHEAVALHREHIKASAELARQLGI